MVKSDKGNVHIEGTKNQIVVEIISIFKSLLEDEYYDIIYLIFKMLDM